jgi:uncharacterized protein
MALGTQQFTTHGTAGLLEGRVHTPLAEPHSIALVAHPLPIMGGTMDNKVVTTLAKTFVELGAVTLRFNFRGVGASEGEYTGGDGELDDLLSVAQFARQQFGDLPLILSGFSFGGYVAARAAPILQPRHLILAAPAVGRFAMPNVPSHSLVIHGEHDEVVPLFDALEWARPQHLPIIVLPAAGHFFHGRLTQLRDLVRQHFNGA